ncbi:ubiquitin carboxyl-terminal hydrolase 32-like isoform X2 [Dysidea avara]|uniref:ubiquitin carboxyl-terminal hydrolase 32-like isoform X2 n=1 Tax=Dysidea avara TaxID=196820 RepID=UPI00331FFC71
MGALQSKSKFPISYEEACKRISPDELKRIEEAFHRFSSKGGLLPKITFLHDVLDQTVPPKLAEGIYVAFHGTQKGIQFKDLFCGLVLLTHGTSEEKTKFIFSVYSPDGIHWLRSSLNNFLQASEIQGVDKKEIKELFGNDYEVTYDKFHYWLTNNPNVTSFSAWLLEETGTGSGFQLTDTTTTPNYHQTIAAMAEVSEQDVIDLERRYWLLRSSVPKFDINLFTSIVSPPVPSTLCASLFACFDCNADGHIDLPEFVMSVSKCCRKSQEERLKFCFQVFDIDKDGVLNEVELVQALGHLCVIKEENLPVTDESLHSDTHASSLAQEVLQQYCKTKKGELTLKEYTQWSMDHTDLSMQLMNILFEVGHVKFGIRPATSSEEASVIAGYMLRASRRDAKAGDTVYLIANQWFLQWKKITGYNYSYSLLSDSEPSRQHLHPQSATAATPISTRPKARKKPPKARKEMGDAVDINISSSDDGVAVGGASVCRNDAGDEIDVNDPRSKLGQIDNTSLCMSDSTSSTGKKLINLTSEGGRLREDIILVQHRDFELLPEAVWSALSSWYRNRRSSNNEPPLPRSVISVEGRKPEVEMFPIQFTVYKHTSYAPQAKQGFGWNTISNLFYSFIGTSPSVGGTPSLDNPTHPIVPKRVAYYQASFDKTTNVNQMYDKFHVWMRVKQDDLRLWNFSDEESPQLLDEDSTQTLIDLSFNDGQPLLIEIRNKDNSWPEEMIKLLKELKAKEKKKQSHTDSTATVEGHVPEGATGLSNLGNTCFMNSGVQCISNTGPLTKYFTDNMYRQEINKENPLGLKGTMAKRYAELIRDLWSGKYKSIVPLKFRWTIGRYAPQFNGFQQQDAQELLNFLLDGLHEDLNRIIKKPYRELQDSNGRPDEIVANEAWDYHLERNNSIVVDLFQGQLKSKVRCLTCGYTSVKFDPFTFLSLPLPVESKVNLEVIVVRLDGTTPVRYSLREEMDHKYLNLKKSLSELSGIPVHCLQLCEVMAAYVRTWLRDTTKISSAIFGGSLYAYEVPEPPAPQPVSRMDSPDTFARMQKLKELNAKTEDIGPTITVETDTQEVTAPSGSHDAADEVSHDAISSSPDHQGSSSHDPQQSSHDVEEGDVKPIDNGEEGEHKTETQEDKTNSEAQGERRKEDTAATTEEKAKTSGDQQITTGGGQEKSSQAPFAAVPSTSIGSGLYVVAMHRKMLDSESSYMVAIHKLRPNLFGIPVIVPCATSSTHYNLYKEVWRQIKRLVVPKLVKSTDEPEFPFTLKMVARDGLSCSQCPWYRFCRGCLLTCNDTVFASKCDYLAIDWDPTVRHIRYQSALERPIDHESIKQAREVVEKPIDLYDCLNAFTKEEKLGENETWMCKRCQKHQQVGKRLEIWRLPPVLIVHLKRFQFVNNQWTKSQQYVNFSDTFNPLAYRDCPEYNSTESYHGSQCSTPSISKCATPTILPSRGSTGSMCNLLIQNEGNSACSTLSREMNLEDSAGDEQLVLNAAAENLNFNSEDNNYTEGQLAMDGTEAQDESEEVPPLPVAAGSDTVFTSGGSDSDLPQNGEIAAEIASAKAISVARLNSPITYNLYAIASHTGVLGGGHYISYAKNPNGQWYYYNDSSCKVTTQDKVLGDSPYLLFYERQNLDHEKFFSKVTKGAKNDEDSDSEEGTDDDRCVVQ